MVGKPFLFLVFILTFVGSAAIVGSFHVFFCDFASYRFYHSCVTLCAFSLRLSFQRVKLELYMCGTSPFETLLFEFSFKLCESMYCARENRLLRCL